MGQWWDRLFNHSSLSATGYIRAMKLFFYLLALLSGVPASQNVQAAPTGVRAETTITAAVGAVLLQHVTEARAATRNIPAAPIVSNFKSPKKTDAFFSSAVILKADRARE